jgi:hypothetical protein
MITLSLERIDVKKIAYQFCLLILVAPCTLGASKFLICPAKGQSTSIRIEPSQIEEINVGEQFTVNVTVQNCVDVYAVQVDFHYNFEVLEVLSVQAGDFLEGGFVIAANGTVHEEAVPPYARVYFIETLLGEVPGRYGNGLLFNVTFQVLSAGASYLTFTPYVPHSSSSEGTYFVGPFPELIEYYPEFSDAIYIPEFPSLIILPLFMTATLIAALVLKSSRAKQK